MLNFQAEEVECVLKKPGKLMYTGETVEGTLRLPAFGTAVYEMVEE